MQIGIGIEVAIPSGEHDGNAVLAAWGTYAAALLAAHGFETAAEVEYIDHFEGEAVGRLWLENATPAQYKQAAPALLHLSNCLMCSVSGTATQQQTDHVHNVVAAQTDAQSASDVYLDGDSITGNFVLNNAQQLTKVLEAIEQCNANK